MEDLNEANFSHLLINLSNNKDIDAQYASTLSVVHELLSAINFKIFNINKSRKRIPNQSNNIPSFIMQHPREENSIVVELEPSLATFIKQGFNNLVKWPLLNIGIVLSNTSTAVNEEWLTAVEHIPTMKIFYKHIHKILTREMGF